MATHQQSTQVFFITTKHIPSAIENHDSFTQPHFSQSNTVDN